jgi:hypothetical protein
LKPEIDSLNFQHHSSFILYLTEQVNKKMSICTSNAYNWHCCSTSYVTRPFQPCLFLHSLWPTRHGLIVGIKCAVSETSKWCKSMKMINIHPPVRKKRVSKDVHKNCGTAIV